MASISKLSIRGVRSFSPNDEEQVISFCFPLTIIVGANGCGKTTIIEALKYSVTGSLPPGNKSGQSFVHDPKSIGQSVVKANVKLRFNNRGNQSMVVIRSMEVTQKKTTASFKALDGIIRTQDPNTGERVSLSHKCTELDKQIPALMGVSKPILEHVVFCHQEDSSWPLQEGAVLKKRFDDIFDSTRYAKALEAIKTSRKEYAATVKDLKADLEGLKSHKHAAAGFLQELDDCKDKISEFDDEIQRCNEGMEKEQARASEAMQELNQIARFESEMDAKQQEMDKEEAVLDSQREMLGQDDMTETHSLDQLKAMLRELDDKHHGNQAERDLMENEREIERIGRELEKARRMTNEYNAEKGKLEAARDAHNKVLKDRFKIMEEIHKNHDVVCDATQTQDDDTLTQGTAASRMSLSTIFTAGASTLGDDVTISQEDVDAFSRGLVQKRNLLSENLKSAKERHRSAEDDMQKKISDIQAKLSGVESNQKRIEESKKQAMRELETVKSQMSSTYTRVREGDVADAKKQAANLAKSRDSCNNDPRREQIQQEHKVLEDKLKSLSDRIEQDSKVRDQLRSQTEAQSEIDMLVKQAGQEYDGLTEKIRENSGLLSANGEVIRINEEDAVQPIQVVKGSIRQKYDNTERDIDRCHKAVADLQSKVVEKKALLQNHRGRLAQLKNRASQLDHEDGPVQKINRVTSALVREQRELIGDDDEAVNLNTPPADVIKFISNRITDIGAVLKDDQIVKVIKRLKKMGKDSCPCCTRDFNNMDELKTFTNRMAELGDLDTSELIRLNQDKTKEAGTFLSKLERWKEVMSDNIISYNEFTNINKEIRELESHIEAEGDAELKNLQEALEREQSKVVIKKEETQNLRKLLDVVNGLVNMAERFWDKKRQVKDKKDELQRNSLGYLANDSRSLKQVEKDIAESGVAKEKAYSEISRLNEEQRQINENISRVTNQAAAAEKHAREKEEAFNKDQVAKKRTNELNDTLQKLAEEAKHYDKSIHPLNADMISTMQSRDKMRKHNNDEETMLADKLRCFEKDEQRLHDVMENIDEYLRSDNERMMEEIVAQIVGNANKIKDNEAKIERMKPEIDKLKKQVDDSEREKAKIKSNIDVMKLAKRVEEISAEFGKMVEEKSKMGGEDAKRRHGQARKKYEEYKNMITRIEGQKQMLDEQKRNLKRKLKQKEYHNVEDRHRDTMIDYETTQIVVNDLDKYYDALDKALLRYHGMKINDINKIIRELWTLCYKGEDITNISITSDQDKGGRASRSYNYRIVMSKGSSTMDMRGRCSAGQRVLASIVIRLALAETFCLNCGVMALDEPTTNLDDKNKQGLAIALAQIIASRAAQSNFQLVVITHDEDFVSLMKHELASQTGFNMPERYYQVSREQSDDGKFYSRIAAVDWDEL